MNVEAGAFDVTDALGPDFVYLQPAGEQRFEPATVATAVGLAVLTAVAAGILEGIRQAARDETKSVIVAVVGAVKRRAHDYLRRPFEPGASGEELLRRHLDEAKKRVEAAQDALRQLPAGVSDELAAPVAVAIRESLREHGLPEKPGERVERVVELRVRTLTKRAASSGANGFRE